MPAPIASTIGTPPLPERFAEQGYLGPIDVLSKSERRRFRSLASSEPLDWPKGHAASSRAYHEIATRPAILDVVTRLLGDDVVLWGASLTKRACGTLHPWHSDMECSAPTARAVSVWIGLKGTSRAASLTLATRSHRFGVTLQEVRGKHRRQRQDVCDEDVLGWAREYDAGSRLVTPDVRDGQALFLDGHLWHAAHNDSRKRRTALLLQYATPDSPIRIPDAGQADWPFRWRREPAPPCILVSGRDAAGTQRIVPAPSTDAPRRSAQLSSRVERLPVPLEPDEQTGWRPYPLFHGRTPNLRRLSCHASVLAPGHSPHPPHVHRDEEILIVLSGEVTLLLPELPRAAGSPEPRLARGHFAYYPARFRHSLRTIGDEPASYLMFRWRNRGFGSLRGTLPHGRYQPFDQGPAVPAERGFEPRRIFKKRTAWLRRLECHTSTVQPGAGYAAHVDAHDVAIVVLEGQVETLGRSVGPHGVIFYPAGQPHGLRNAGDATARYLVFEFHGPRRPRWPRLALFGNDRAAAG